MAHDIVKFALAIAVLVVIAAVVGLFVSGYLAATKPANRTAQATPSGISGGRGAAAIASPSPTPRPAMPMGMPYGAYGPPPVPMTPEAPMTNMDMAPQPVQQPLPTAQPTIMPASPTMTLWYYILQDLLRIFPGLFSGLQRAFPQWPVGWFSPA